MECWRLTGEGLMDCVFWCLTGEQLGDVGDHHVIVLGGTSIWLRMA